MDNSQMRYEALHPLVEEILGKLSEKIGVNTLFFALNDLNSNFVVKAINHDKELIEEGTTHVFQHVLCKLVIDETDGKIQINDLLANPQTVNHPVTQNLGTGSFLGVAIKNADNEKIGTLCAFDDRPYEFDSADLKLIESYADIISKSISVETYVIKDALTDVYNERYMNRLISSVTNHPAFLMVLNLDNFHAINATYGYRVGNRVLQEIASRLKHVPIPEHVVGRMDGNEFIILAPLEQMAFADQGKKFAQSIIESIERPIVHLADEPIHLTASSGVSLLTGDHMNRQTQVYAAEALMQQVKLDGKAGILFVDQQRDLEQHPFNHVLEQELSHALERGQFELYYQRILNAKLGQTVAAEALLRWNHPILGFVSPTDFIPIAERMGKFGQIGRFTVCQAISDSLRLETELGRPVMISVNLSASQFQSDSMIAELLQFAGQDTFKRDRIVLEIREEVLQTGKRTAIERLESLRQAGYRLSVDHFGSHYASLNSLLRLPVQSVKLDPIFTRRLAQNQLEQSMLQSVYALTQALEIALVIQEVETVSQFRQIVALGERLYVQGHYLHHPQPISNLIADFSKVIHTSDV
ncbi:bifunctional diguanylate cyclase/phosphodiesterase [Exiguobacterium antarcticum]|uniref:Bifunctional diguanylate cyclase/phosphodiesterase n=1 Tax=Exiguobacterium antarcticum TaxID=132920 RepID=A0ABT6R1X1_9BACL|nr:bifunctional diguanylate cyclase/phosphodiesterase [Exiguobacterium antarcticum]MDI3234311.1 bifunctional diguanylate cyclase/phosphodiesterase [Exiguobacterium antarcticum]